MQPLTFQLLHAHAVTHRCGRTLNGEVRNQQVMNDGPACSLLVRWRLRCRPPPPPPPGMLGLSGLESRGFFVRRLLDRIGAEVRGLATAVGHRTRAVSGPYTPLHWIIAPCLRVPLRGPDMQVHFFAREEYKSAANTLRYSGFTEPQRENLTSLLGDMAEQVRGAALAVTVERRNRNQVRGDGHGADPTSPLYSCPAWQAPVWCTACLVTNVWL